MHRNKESKKNIVWKRKILAEKEIFDSLMTSDCQKRELFMIDVDGCSCCECCLKLTLSTESSNIGNNDEEISSKMAINADKFPLVAAAINGDNLKCF